MRVETRRMTRMAAVGATALAVLIAGAARAQDRDNRDDRDDRAERVERVSHSEDFSWSGTVERGKTVEIHNLNGFVHVEPASGRTLEVRAEKHSRHSDLSSVKIEVTPSDDGVMICALYPGMESCEDQHVHHHSDSDLDDNDVVVDFTIRVPAGVTLEARTVNGSVKANDLDGPTNVSTVNGSVEMSTSGQGKAQSVNGSVVARIGSVRWDGQLVFKSVNGTVSVELPAGLKATLAASTTNGTIHSDFPVTVAGTISPKKLSGTINGGGGDLKVATVNGNIELRTAGGGRGNSGGGSDE